jgi:hypothetical protein
LDLAVVDVDEILGLLGSGLDYGCCRVGLMHVGAHVVIGLPDLVVARPHKSKDAFLLVLLLLAKNNDLMYDCTVAVTGISITLHSHSVV